MGMRFWCAVLWNRGSVSSMVSILFGPRGNVPLWLFHFVPRILFLFLFVNFIIVFHRFSTTSFFFWCLLKPVCVVIAFMVFVPFGVFLCGFTPSQQKKVVRREVLRKNSYSYPAWLDGMGAQWNSYSRDFSLPISFVWANKKKLGIVPPQLIYMGDLDSRDVWLPWSWYHGTLGGRSCWKGKSHQGPGVWVGLWYYFASGVQGGRPLCFLFRLLGGLGWDDWACLNAEGSSGGILTGWFSRFFTVLKKKFSPCWPPSSPSFFALLHVWRLFMVLNSADLKEKFFTKPRAFRSVVVCPSWASAYWEEILIIRRGNPQRLKDSMRF